MEFHNNESSLHFDATHHNSVIESILLEPPTTAAPVQAPKPSSSYQVPDFEKVNFSLSSDASESDHVVFNNDLQNSRTRNHSPTSKYNKIASAPTFPCFHAKLPPGVRPNRKHDFEEIHEPGLNSFQKCTESSFNPHMNDIPSKSRVKNLVSATAYHQLSNHSSKNCMLENNGELRPEFNRLNEMNSPFFSGYQNVCSASSHFENSKTLTVPQCTVKGNLLNESDSVTLLPQQLQFHESYDAMNDYLNTNNISNSEYVPEKDSSPLHAMKMHKKFRKHRSLDDVENMSVRPKLQQESHPIDSGISPFYDLSSCNTNAKISVPNDFWALFREQNEKIEQIQNQLLTIQKQNNSVAVSKQETTLELSKDKKFEVIDKNLNTILKYLTENNNTLLTLSDQVSILARRTDELESKSKTNVSKPLDSNTGATSSAEASNRHNSNDDVMCHNETHVKKTSSSTMTSITLDGNEKFMFCKTTVVTENCKRDLLLQHLQNENPPAKNTNLNKAQSSSKEVALNLCTNCTTPKSLNFKKTEKHNKNSDNVTPISDCDSHGTPTVRLRSSNEKSSSPQCDSSRTNTNANGRLSSEDSSPNFDRILRNIENLALGKSEDEKTSSKHCDSCCCSDMSNSSGTCKVEKRKSKSYKKSLACAYSSTNEDADYARPNYGWTEDDAYTNEWYETTKKKYGIPPSLLSVDTQQYLEKHCLYGNIEKQSSKKSTAPHPKRQIR